MKVGIPTYGCDGGKSGISRYVIELIKAMAEQRGDDTLEVLSLPEERGIFVTPEPGVEEICPRGAVAGPPRNILWHLTRLPRVVRERQYDVLFCPAANRRLPWRVCCPVVGTIHDFSWLHMSGKYDRFRTFYLTQVLPRMMNRLRFAITVSESSKHDIVANTTLPAERVRVIPIAMDHTIYNKDSVPDPDVLARHGIKGEYVFYVSRLEHPGKNHQTLIRAFEKLCATGDFDTTLVLAGGDFLGAQAVHGLIERSPARDRIQRLGFVDTSDLPSLFAGASVFAFPSLYEGFGIPVLEAMACGVPVVASDCSSIPEVGGDAVSYFDPSDVDALCRELGKLLSDAELRRRRSAAGIARAATFSWARTAQRTWDVLRAVSGGVS
jgi:glycosyltransferase involved in cell wall biosynthesis